MTLQAKFLNKAVKLWTVQGPLTVHDLQDPKISHALSRYLVNVVEEIAPWLAQTRAQI